MTWPSHALYTLAEFRDFVKPSGNARDSLYASMAGWVAGDIERATDRRLVFRAPTEDDDAIYSGAWATGTPAPAGQPTTPGRTLVVTFPSTATAGVLTVTGTVAGVAGVTEVFTVPAMIGGVHVSSLVQYGIKYFTAISALTITGATGSGTVKLGTSLGYVDYHSPHISGGYARFGSRSEIWSLEWPVRQVGALYEDTDLVYGSDTLLVASTDYLVVDGERIVRLSGSLPSYWAGTYRSVKLLNSAGYFGSATLPGTIKRIALRLGAMYDQESAKGQIELASGSNALGTWSRSGQAALTADMRRELAPFRRQGSFDGAERGYDLEAA